MSVTLRLSEQDLALIRDYAKLKGTTVSDFMRRAALEKIEDEMDLKLWEKAYTDYASNPISYTLDEAEKELGLR